MLAASLLGGKTVKWSIHLGAVYLTVHPYPAAAARSSETAGDTVKAEEAEQ